MGKREVDAVLARLGRLEKPIPMPREVAIALAVVFQMVGYSGTLAQRPRTLEEVRAKCTAEYDRRAALKAAESDRSQAQHMRA